MLGRRGLLALLAAAALAPLALQAGPRDGAPGRAGADPGPADAPARGDARTARAPAIGAPGGSLRHAAAPDAAPRRAPDVAVPVFEPIAAQDLPPDARTDFDRDVYRERFARVRGDWAEARVLDWNLFDDVRLRAERRSLTSLDPTGSHRVWRGRVAGDPESEVLALLAAGRITASIALSDGSVFTVDTLPSGVQRVREQNPGALPGCGSVGHERALAAPATGAAEPDAAPPPAAAAASSGATLDVLLLYTPGAVAAYGAGVTGLHDRLALVVQWANVLYENTGVPQRLRAAGMVQVDYDDSHGDGRKALDDLTFVNDGLLEEVPALRDQLGADLVTLVTRPSDVCGIAWIATDAANIAWYENYMFSVMNVLCTGSGRTLAHELGHNQGAYHDPATSLQQGMSQAEIDAVAPPNGFGYIAPGDAFHTTMAYGGTCSGCPFVQHFSSPALSYQGQPTGDTRSDVKTTLEATYATIGAFRPETACAASGDGDGDTVCDDVDNCLAIANPSQIDSDLDGFGNACDADYDNDGVVGIPDYARFGAAFGTAAGDAGYDPPCDHDGDGVIGVEDYSAFGGLFGRSPGPSALACAGASCAP